MFKHFILLIHLILTTAELDIVIVQMRELRHWLRNTYLLDKARLEINAYNCYITIIICFVNFMGKIISPQTKEKISKNFSMSQSLRL